MTASTPPTKNTTDCLQTILKAITSGDYAFFTSVGNSAYKTGITQQMFESVSEQLAPRLKENYTTTYFGHIRQLHYQIYLWKLSFSDGGDEFVIRMAMDEENVAGILIT